MLRRPRPFWNTVQPRTPRYWKPARSKSDRQALARSVYSPPRRSKARTNKNENGEERVKRCLNCEHFSCDHINCTNCGLQLRTDAKLFLNPFKVYEVFKDLFDVVKNMGPDFQPLRFNLTSQISSSSKPTDDDCTQDAQEQELQSEISDVEEDTIQHEQDERLASADDNIPTITISSSSDEENESDSPPDDSVEGDGDSIDEGPSEFSNQSTSRCIPKYVKRCPLCNIYSSNLQQCETCDNTIPPENETLNYQRLTRAQLGRSEWYKSRFEYQMLRKKGLTVPNRDKNMYLRFIDKQKEADAYMKKMAKTSVEMKKKYYVLKSRRKKARDKKRKKGMTQNGAEMNNENNSKVGKRQAKRKKKGRVSRAS